MMRYLSKVVVSILIVLLVLPGKSYAWADWDECLTYRAPSVMEIPQLANLSANEKARISRRLQGVIGDRSGRNKEKQRLAILSQEKLGPAQRPELYTPQQLRKASGASCSVLWIPGAWLAQEPRTLQGICTINQSNAMICQVPCLEFENIGNSKTCTVRVGNNECGNCTGTCFKVTKYYSGTYTDSYECR